MKKINNLIALLFIIFNFANIDAMEKPLVKKRKVVELVNKKNKKSKIDWFSILPAELKHNIFKKAIKVLVKDNSHDGLKAFCEVSRFLKSIPLVDKDFRDFKNDLIDFANKRLARYFSKKYNLNEQEKEQELKKACMGNYSKSKETKAAELLMVGANPNVRINYKRYNNITLLDKILRSGKYDRLVPLLLKYGINSNTRFYDGLEHNFLLAIRLKNKSIIEQLLQYSKLDVNCEYRARDCFGYRIENALGVAAAVNDMEIVLKIMNRQDFDINSYMNFKIFEKAILLHNQKLLDLFLNHRDFNKLILNEKGSFIHKRSSIALYKAIEVVNLDLVKIILNKYYHNIDFNYCCNSYTPLLLAVINNKLEIVQEILKYADLIGIDINFKDSCRTTALGHALKSGYWDIVNALCTIKSLSVDKVNDAGQLYQILRFAIANNNDELAKNCLLKANEFNIDINREDSVALDVDLYNGKSVLSIAFELNNFTIINMLSAITYLDVDKVDNSLQLWQILMFAIKNNNNLLVIKLLIKGKDLGIDINIADPNGRTALMHAVICNNIKAVKLILAYYPGIATLAFDCNGNTPLSLAILNNYLDIAKLIAKQLGIKLENYDNNCLSQDMLNKKYQDILNFMD